MKKQYFIVLSLLAGLFPANMSAQSAQNNATWQSKIKDTQVEDTLGYSYKTFEQEVLNYSHELKQSTQKQIAMKKAMQVAKTAFLPAIDASGNYQYRINDYEMSFGADAIPFKHDAYSAGVTVMQPVYAGGSVAYNYKAQKIQSAIADQSVDLTKDNVIYAAENSYWRASAQKEMYRVMCRFTDIVGELVNVLQDRYNDGMISKTDLIQMQARMKDAEMQRLNALESYKLAAQNMNVLMGKHPTDSICIAENISKEDQMPLLNNVENVLNLRPDFAISKLNVDYQKNQIALSSAKYNPTLSVGYQGVWGTQMLNIDGETKFNSTLLVSLKIPIFRWGARFKNRSAQKALFKRSQYELQDKQDQISKELAKAWTNLSESKKRIQLAKENCTLADENLDLNTFSYTEGKLSVLDVLSAQLTWIQAYTNLIQSYYQQKIALADYNKASGNRYK